MKYLIVNADDYGLTPGVSEGIRQANLNGIVTSTTAMMNMPHAPDALVAAAKQNPALGLGVHLTLTAGAPVLSPRLVPSLVDESGRFYRPDKLEARLGQVDLQQVMAEWRAQIEGFCQVTGHGPDHLDGHHHVPYLPPLFDLMLSLAAEHHCPVRSPLADTPEAASVLLERPELAAEARRRMAEHRVQTTEHMSIAYYDETATLEVLTGIIATLQEGTTEIMSHPGHADAELFSKSSYNRQREKELSVLTSDAAKEAVTNARVRLINFGQLPGGDKGDARP